MNEVAAAGHGLLIQRRADSQGVVLFLSGELDLATAPGLDRELRAAGEAHPGRLLVDLRGLQFIDSVGLGSIIRAQQFATAGDHVLSLRRGPAQVQRLFDLVGLSDRFKFED
ncbi:MAG: STAS domain-containing protein [Actinomycetota bacterium]|nr:STAS domain-containing protein [Actinomycetota bacterium]